MMAITDQDSLACKKQPSDEFKRDGEKQERWDKEQEKNKINWCMSRGGGGEVE